MGEWASRWIDVEADLKGVVGAMFDFNLKKKILSMK